MTESSEHEVTQLLQAWSEGDEQALGKLIPLVHRNCTGWPGVTWLANLPATPFKPRH